MRSTFAKSFFKDNICFKNYSNTTCINLAIRNAPKRFQESVIIKTGLSDFYKMSLTVMNLSYNEQKAIVIQCRKHKNGSN